MIVEFHNNTWLTAKRGAICKGGKVLHASPEIHYMQGADIQFLMRWAMMNSDSVRILWSQEEIEDNYVQQRLKEIKKELGDKEHEFNYERHSSGS